MTECKKCRNNMENNAYFNKKMVLCPACDTEVCAFCLYTTPKIELQQTEDGLWCNQCVAERERGNIIECANCEKLLWLDTTYPSDEGDMCDGCIKAYKECVRCGTGCRGDYCFGCLEDLDLFYLRKR